MYANWPARIFADGKLLDLQDRVLGLEKKLQENDYTPKMVGAIYCGSSVHYLTAYYTLFKNDFIPLILKYLPGNDELAQLAADFILTDVSGRIEITELSRGKGHPYRNIEDCQVILQTSGSTGEPKHVCWSPSGVHYQSIATAKILEYTADDCLAVMMPIHTAYALSLLHIAFCHKLPLCLSSSLEACDVLPYLNSSRATTVDALPGKYIGILDYLEKHPELKKELAGIRVWNCGGDSLTQELALRWNKAMGGPLLDGYGLSEAGPNVAVNGPRHYRFGTVGKALEETDLRISPSGELLVKSPSIIKQYLRGNKLVCDDDGWLCTGDRASLDAEGYLTIHGRIA